MQQLIDQVHLIHQTSSTTFPNSHNNLTFVSRHPIILCWLATSATKNWSANQHQNCSPLLCLSPFFVFLPSSSIHSNHPPSILPALSLLNCPSSSFDPPPSLLAFFFTLQTAIFHNLSTDLSHNSEPPHRLHTHSVQLSCKSPSTTPHSQTSKASHAEVK